MHESKGAMRSDSPTMTHGIKKFKKQYRGQSIIFLFQPQIKEGLKITKGVGVNLPDSSCDLSQDESNPSLIYGTS